MLNEIDSKVILKFLEIFFGVRDCDWGGMACNTPGGGERLEVPHSLIQSPHGR